MTSPAPLVDVGIPVFRRVEYLAGAIESVLAQSLTRFRLVVSEDGWATPAVQKVLEPYLSDPRVSVTSSGEHVGAARHLTRIVAGGQAPYFALLHDDDLWDERFLEARVGLLEARPECAFVFSPVRVIDADGVETERMPVLLSAGVHQPAEIVPQLVADNFIPSTTVVVRRTAYDQVGGSFDPSFVRIYDHELWFRLATSAPVGFLREHDAAWRAHPDQSSKSVADRQREFVLFLQQARKRLEGMPGLGLSERDARQILARWSLSNALDAAEQGETRVSLANAQAAIRAYPTIALDPRLATLLLTLPLGAPGRRALHSLRTQIRRRDINVHVRTRTRHQPRRH